MGEGSPELEAGLEPDGVILADSVHVMDRHDGVCVAAIVTGRTPSAYVLDLTAWPRGGGNYPVNASLFDPAGERPNSWHHPEHCPRPYIPHPLRQGLSQLIPMAYVAGAIHWHGDEAEVHTVRRLTGRRENGDHRFLLPGDISGSWRHPHVFNEARQAWEPVRAGDWIVSGHQDEWTVIPGRVVADRFEHLPL